METTVVALVAVVITVVVIGAVVAGVNVSSSMTSDWRDSTA